MYLSLCHVCFLLLPCTNSNLGYLFQCGPSVRPVWIFQISLQPMSTQISMRPVWTRTSLQQVWIQISLRPVCTRSACSQCGPRRVCNQYGLRPARNNCGSRPACNQCGPGSACNLCEQLRTDRLCLWLICWLIYLQCISVFQMVPYGTCLHVAGTGQRLRGVSNWILRSYQSGYVSSCAAKKSSQS